MTNDNHISKLWKTQEEEKNLGLVKRLYSTEYKYRIYATFQYPEHYYGIAFTFGNDIGIDISSFEDLSELKVLLVPDTAYINSRLLIIQLLHPINRDIFTSLCENLILSVYQLNNEQKIIRTVINQLEKWKTLFDKNNLTGLTSNEQQGLFGELHFLQKCLSRFKMKPSSILKKWVGVNRAMRDFQGSNWAIEVKTTSTNNPQKVTINGERQLDESLLDNLFLVHYSIEVSNGNGQTLCQKVAEIRKSLSNDATSLSIFNVKLFEVGYLDKHESYYQTKHYLQRSESFYKVDSHFPRIKENELRNGVSDVKYSITLSSCDEFLTSENKLYNIIKDI